MISTVLQFVLMHSPSPAHRKQVRKYGQTCRMKSRDNFGKHQAYQLAVFREGTHICTHRAKEAFLPEYRFSENRIYLILIARSKTFKHNMKRTVILCHLCCRADCFSVSNSSSASISSSRPMVISLAYFLSLKHPFFKNCVPCKIKETACTRAPFSL